MNTIASYVEDQIESEISKRSSNKFGIKVGMGVFKILGNAGFIQMVPFSVSGTGLFPTNLFAYKGKYHIYCDWEMEDYDFEVGTP